MSEEMQTEAERLVGIAQLHAWNALARPPAQRDAHIASCRGFWKSYAAAITTSAIACEGFADTLEHATRDLMVEMQKNIAVIREAGGFRMFQDPDRLQPRTANGFTLEELRPIFRQIIGQ